MDGNNQAQENGRVILLDEPTLGKRVELVEGTVGDALDLIELGGTVPNLVFGLHALAISLRVDGKKFTVEELRALRGSAFNAVLRASGEAIKLNNFFPKDDDEEADPTEKKS